MNPSLALGTAALAVVSAAPALATTATATLTQRESVSHIELTGGYGPASVSFSDGSTLPVTAFGSGELVLSGSASGFDRASVYDVNFSATWDQRQSYSFQTVGSDAVLQASGSLAVLMESDWYNHAVDLGGSPATQFYTSLNWQAFEFVLDQTTDFSFSGGTIDGQRLEMFRWSDGGWAQAAYIVTPGSGVDFSNSGQIDAGRYLLRNAPVPVFRIQTAATANGWNYTLTLHNTVAAVPEPATVATMLAGLGLIGWRLRGRHGA